VSDLAEAFESQRPRLFVNGEPAMLAFDAETLAGVLCFEAVGDQIAALRAIANPDKLRFLAEQLSHPAALPGS
jgi:hypothetical protein